MVLQIVYAVDDVEPLADGLRKARRNPRAVMAALRITASSIIPAR